MSDVIMRTVKYIDAHANIRLETLFSLAASMMQIINSLSNAIDQLPNKTEFNAAKAELKKEVNEKLGPLREEYDKWKEIQKRGEDTDAYS